MKKAALVLLLIICVAIFGGCSISPTHAATGQERQINVMDRIWLPENGISTPFLVLEITEDDYLLIREHTTGPCAFVYSDSPNSYYAASALDDYLNVEYASRFSLDVQKYLRESDVVITRETSIGCCGGETETIKRVFYAPSWTETTGMHNSIGLEEGIKFPEKFRKDYLATTNDSGEPSAWWLRTPDTWDFNRVFGINEDGGVSTGSTVDSIEVYEAEVRPVFRISITLPLVFEDEQWRMQINTE